jgi:hypothetical protein
VTAAYLDRLLAAAGVADCAEAEFRQYAERRLEIMTAARVRAHRRYHLVHDMVESARAIVERPACIAAQIGCVLIQAGWSADDAGYGEVCERLGRVAALIHDDLHREPCADQPCADQPCADQPSMGVLPALATFEAWYYERFGTEFPVLLPRSPNVFQPLVDF